MATIPVDAKIAAFIAGKPWLKMVLTVAMSILGIAKGRGWFERTYGIQ
jgi:hypothetical protein